jgi:hypothetical protein
MSNPSNDDSSFPVTSRSFTKMLKSIFQLPDNIKRLDITLEPGETVKIKIEYYPSKEECTNLITELATYELVKK